MADGVGVHVPGGGVFGRSARREVRNPVMALPAARAILALPEEQRRPIAALFGDLAKQADAQAETAWRKRKGIMAAYWRAVSTYAKHVDRVIAPRSQEITHG